MIGYTAKQSNRLLCTLIPPNVVSALTSGSSGYNGDGCAGGPIGREIQHCTVMFCSLAQLGELQVDDLTWHPLKALLAHSVPFALFMFSSLIRCLAHSILHCCVLRRGLNLKFAHCIFPSCLQIRSEPSLPLHLFL